MQRVKVRKPRCDECPQRLVYMDSIPKKVHGAFLKFGYRYCSAGKSMREFKKADPKVYPPSWCPRMKSPPEFRVYHYKDALTAWLQRQLEKDGVEGNPSGYRYAIRHEGHINFSAKEFWDMVHERPLADFMDIPVHPNEVIEIDDGLKPYYFFLPESSVIVPIYFDGETARKNRLESQ